MTLTQSSSRPCLLADTHSKAKQPHSAAPGPTKIAEVIANEVLAPDIHARLNCFLIHAARTLEGDTLN